MKVRKSTLLFVLVSLLAGNVHSQPKPMKWGEVSAADLEMTTYAADTNAVAVILGEYGEIRVNKLGEVVFDYHIRVKLLSEAAYDDWGTYRLIYNKGALNERIRNLKGQTLLPTPKGKPEIHKLDKKSIFKEQQGDIEQIKFTLPALQPGAIVEYEYRLISDTPVVLPEWTFQHDEPTRWSELRADISQWYNHVRVSTVTHYAIEEQEENPVRDNKSMRYRWAVQDVPALREEPFVTTIEDYREKMEFQLASYFHPTLGTTKYMRSWEELADELRGINDFGRAFSPTRQTSSLAEEVVAGLTSPKEKMIAIYNYVRDKHLWNGEYGYVPDRGLNASIKADRLSAPEQVILMIAMMRSVGIDANPVLISTRQHGRMQNIYPIFSQFNYVIARADVAGREYLLDATDWKSPYNLLAERALNGSGWMVTEKGHQWIPIRSSEKYAQLTSLEGKVDEDGVGEFKLASSNAGYRALILRNALEEVDQDEFMGKAILESVGEFEVRDVQITNRDSLDKTLIIDAQLRIQNFAMVAGDFIYLNPHVVNTWDENPLRLPERTFPVDFSFPRDYVYNLRLEIPEGYTVHEQPPGMNLKLPERGGAFLRQITSDGNTINVQTRFTLAKASYSPKMYHNLKELYDRIVAAQAEQIVLKRTTQ